MYEQIFGKYPQVKVINYILINPEKTYSKKEIAVGAGISRVTLDSFIKNLEELNIIKKEGLKYKINTESKLVKTLIKTQINLAEILMQEYIENNKNTDKEITDQELDDFLDNFNYEVNIDQELKKIENKDKYTLLDNSKIILPKHPQTIASTDIQRDFVIKGFVNNDKNGKMINYG
ncbi:hypothetical protein [Methanosphaera sp. WGK6]|uniref:hypothetical protein n=1 Tax=Methanosphaera sp. WGK6 TaxID=1561964 RepID=UPI00084CD2AD|nr:hypothetical protein [Methanosphaera sp. WGK6]OED29816.1 hypothetical protein NL43_06480 [Methanosphaera sp. WGK6]